MGSAHGPTYTQEWKQKIRCSDIPEKPPDFPVFVIVTYGEPGHGSTFVFGLGLTPLASVIQTSCRIGAYRRLCVYILDPIWCVYILARQT